MIKNERQFRITKAQADRFRNTIQSLEAAPQDGKMHPRLRKAEIDGLRSQLADLDSDIREYEDLRSGRRSITSIQTFEDVPRALVQARIAAGLTQEQLADKLNIKPQQIQRYEATEYKSASLARIADVVRALGVKVNNDILSSTSAGSISQLLPRLEAVGLPSDFVIRRLLPQLSASLADDPGDSLSTDVAVEAAEALSRIYGWSPAVLFGKQALQVASGPSALARFKLPARVRKAGLGGYVVYAHYLALLVLEATPDLAPQPLPDDPSVVRRAILSRYGQLTFETTLKYVWSLGVPVLPLNDPGAFSGASWRVKGRNVVVLRQRTSSASRWLHDLLHEYLHAARAPNLEEHPVIEESEMSDARRESPEEIQASRFAGDVMLDGRAEELAEKCVKAAKGKVEYLKAAVPHVAQAAGVSVAALANYMAFRLSLQGTNWWGTATNLQGNGDTALCTPRDMLLSHIRLPHLNSIDRDLLLRALEPIVLAFSARIGSGKSTVSQQVATALGWKRASFGDYLRTFARSQGHETSREVLQELGEGLVARDPEGLCRSVLTHFGWRSGEPLVIDGVRHEAVVGALRRLVAPLELRLVFIDVNEETRRKRLLQRGKYAVSTLNAVEAHSTEREVADTLAAMAECRVQGDRPAKEVVHDVVCWVHQGDGVASACTE